MEVSIDPQIRITEPAKADIQQAFEWWAENRSADQAAEPAARHSIRFGQMFWEETVVDDRGMPRSQADRLVSLTSPVEHPGQHRYVQVSVIVDADFARCEVVGGDEGDKISRRHAAYRIASTQEPPHLERLAARLERLESL